MFKKTLISLAVASSVGLTGCFDSGETGANANPDYQINNPDFTGKTWPIFNPLTSELPIPNDLIFDSEQGDGTFGVGDTSPPVTTALNELSGASTVAPAVIQFNSQIAEESVVYGQSVFLIELEYASGDPVQGLSNQEPPTVSGLATARADVETLDGTSAIRILPLEPLNPRKRYIAVVTKGVTDINGDAIVASPSYQNLTDPDLPLGSSALEPVRALINGLWEATAEGFFEVAEAPLTADDIAISYSFTTSNDEKVLQYIAEPGAWFADQLSTFVKVTTAKQTVAAAKFAADQDDESLTVEDGFDFNDDGEITAADFDVNRDGSFTPADFDWNDDGEFGFADVSASTSAILAGFPSPDVKAALDSDDNCPVTGQDFINCVAPGIANQFAAALPTPTPDNRDAGDFDFGDTPQPTPVALVSSVAASVYQNFATQIAEGGGTPPTVLALEGTVSLPYYLGTSGSDILSDSWQADNALAAGLNLAFQGLGLQIPQADPTTTTAVNYIFPFPKKTADVDVPVLIIYPQTGATKGVVMYQHGITTDRSAALSFGTGLATLGYTVVAIDQPLHGVAAFTEEEQNTLATRLLDAGQDAGLPETLASSETTNAALIAGQLNINFVIQATPATTEEEAQTTIGTVLGGGTTGNEDLDAAILFLAGAENSVANAGSTVPGLSPQVENERHFGLFSPQPGQLAEIDYEEGVGDSGSMYINLLNFTNTRDNSRQSAVDQMNLRVSLNSLDLQPFGGADLEGQQFNFVGHSLGTITGAPFIASVNENQLPAILAGGDPETETPPTPVASSYNDIAAANMLTPGGGIVRLLENSPTFAPRILLGLAGNGLSQGDANLEAFLNVFQAAVDTADPINFTDNLKASTPAYLLSEVEADTVIPNAADEALWGIGPLSATIPASEDVPVAVTVDSFPAPLAGSRPLSLMFDDGVDSAQFEIYAQADYPVAEGEEPLNHGTPVSAAPAAAFGKMVMEADALFTPEAP
jgi:hypothetical protein